MGTKPGYFLHTAWEPNLVIFFTLHRNLCQSFVTLDVPTSCYSWGSTQEPSSATPNAQKKVKRGFRQMKLNGPRRLKSETNCWQCEKHPAQKKSHKPHGRLYSELQASLSSTSLQTLLQLVMPHSCPPMLSEPSERSGY